MHSKINKLKTRMRLHALLYAWLRQRTWIVRKAGRAEDETCGVGVSGDPEPQAFDLRFLIA